LNQAYLGLLAYKQDLLEENLCPFTAAAYVDVLNLFEAAAFALPSLGKLIVESAMTSEYAVQGAQDDYAWLKYATPILRQSLALHQALQWLLRMTSEGGNYHLQELLNHLKEEYPSICVSILEALVNIAPNVPPPAVSILGHTLCELACVPNGIFVQAKSRRLLMLLHERMGKSSNVFSPVISPASMKNSFLEPKFLPPSLVESTVLLWGPLIEQSWHNTPRAFIMSWTQELRSLLLILHSLLHESRVSIGSNYKYIVLTLS
jgi:hypothetical protein